MNKGVDWIQVVLDYGKRFPNVTVYELINCDTLPNIKVSQLKRDHVVFLCLESLTYFSNSYGILKYYYRDFEPVPQHILLRLLTEGKEDLV